MKKIGIKDIKIISQLLKSRIMTKYTNVMESLCINCLKFQESVKK